MKEPLTTLLISLFIGGVLGAFIQGIIDRVKRGRNG